jgi:zinc protease
VKDHANAPLPLDDATLADLNAGKPQGAHVTLVDSHVVGDARVSRFRLGNGLTVLLWPDHRAPVFSFQTWFRVGSRHEKPGRTGIAHLFEHLMFKRTSNHGEGEFDAIMESHGAETNAATWVDWTYYREKLPAGCLEMVCRLEADRIEHLVLDKHQLESEREVVKNERLMRVDNDPEGQLYETLYKTAFLEHPYGWPTIGWMPDIEAITLEDCEAFYQAYYAPNNATVVIVGAVDTAVTLGLIQQYYGHLKRQTLPVETVIVEPTQTEARHRVLDLPLSAAKAIYAFHAPPASDPAHAALEVMNEVLAGGESSVLYRTLVTELELATDISGWTSAWEQPGLYELSLSMRPGRSVEEAEPILFDLLERFCGEPVSQREVDKAINGIEAGFLRSSADFGSRARRLGHAETTLRDYRWYWQHYEKLTAVAPSDVLNVAKALLNATNRTTIIGRPAAPTEADASSEAAAQ